jgi:hypothetical protein
VALISGASTNRCPLEVATLPSVTSKSACLMDLNAGVWLNSGVASVAIKSIILSFISTQSLRGSQPSELGDLHLPGQIVVWYVKVNAGALTPCWRKGLYLFPFGYKQDW